MTPGNKVVSNCFSHSHWPQFSPTLRTAEDVCFFLSCFFLFFSFSSSLSLKKKKKSNYSGWLRQNFIVHSSWAAHALYISGLESNSWTYLNVSLPWPNRFAFYWKYCHMSCQSPDITLCSKHQLTHVNQCLRYDTVTLRLRPEQVLNLSDCRGRNWLRQA